MVKIKLILGALILLLSVQVNAELIDTIHISASGAVEGGGQLTGNLSRLFIVQPGSTFDGC